MMTDIFTPIPGRSQSYMFLGNPAGVSPLITLINLKGCRKKISQSHPWELNLDFL